jgi:DNA ligase (NAD+)
MNIDGFGASHIEKFYELGWIRDMADIYNLNYEHIASLEGFGDKSAKNLQQAIENVKSNSLTRILHSLSIHHLGQRASKLLAQQIKNIFELQDWDNDRFVSIKDIGPVVAENVMAYFKDERNIQMLRRMEEYGVDMTQKEEDKPLEVAEDGSFVGKSILFTGSLQQMTRKEAQELAAKEGARNISAVSSKLDVLVVGEKAGSKLKKARDLGTVTIMTEQEFLDAVDK